MIRKLVAAAGVLLCSGAGAAPLVVDYAKSEITFVSKQMNVPIDGKFKKFSAQLSFDAKAPQSATAKLELDINSVDAGSPDADAEVRKKAWFNPMAFPTATFVSQSVKALGNDRYEVTGQMTIKGKSQKVTTPFTVKAQGGSTMFEGTFVVKRLDFGLGEGPWADTETVANEVQVKFKLLAAPAKP